jgi:hypothetical protein
MHSYLVYQTLNIIFSVLLSLSLMRCELRPENGGCGPLPQSKSTMIELKHLTCLDYVLRFQTHFSFANPK